MTEAADCFIKVPTIGTKFHLELFYKPAKSALTEPRTVYVQYTVDAQPYLQLFLALKLQDRAPCGR